MNRRNTLAAALGLGLLAALLAWQSSPRTRPAAAPASENAVHKQKRPGRPPRSPSPMSPPMPGGTPDALPDPPPTGGGAQAAAQDYLCLAADKRLATLSRLTSTLDATDPPEELARILGRLDRKWLRTSIPSGAGARHASGCPDVEDPTPDLTDALHEAADRRRATDPVRAGEIEGIANGLEQCLASGTCDTGAIEDDD